MHEKIEFATKSSPIDKNLAKVGTLHASYNVGGLEKIIHLWISIHHLYIFIRNFIY